MRYQRKHELSGWDNMRHEPRHDKTNNVSVRPAKTQISLGICPVWSEPSLCAQWVANDPSFLHADSKDSDQTGRMPRLIWVFAGSTCHFVGFVVRRLINSHYKRPSSITCIPVCMSILWKIWGFANEEETLAAHTQSQQPPGNHRQKKNIYIYMSLYI